MVFVKEAIDDRPHCFYDLIHWKGEMHIEDTSELIERITLLQQLLKKYHTKNPNKRIVTYPPIDKGAPTPPMAMQSGMKVASPITLYKYTFTKNLQHMRNCISEPMILFVQVRHSG